LGFVHLLVFYTQKSAAANLSQNHWSTDS